MRRRETSPSDPSHQPADVPRFCCTTGEASTGCARRRQRNFDNTSGFISRRSLHADTPASLGVREKAQPVDVLHLLRPRVEIS